MSSGTPGNDGTPFNLERYTAWALSKKTRSSIYFNKERDAVARKKGPKIRWTCPKCLNSFPGKNAKHLLACAGTYDK